MLEGVIIGRDLYNKVRVELSQDCNQRTSYAGVQGTSARPLSLEWSGRGQLSAVERVKGEAVPEVRGL